MGVNVWVIQLRNSEGQWFDANVSTSFAQTLHIYGDLGEPARVLKDGKVIHPLPTDGQLDLQGSTT